MTDIVIASAARTPIGSFNGSFATLAAHELGAVAVKEAMNRAGVDGAEVDELVMGQILTAAQGMNPARQTSMKAGIPTDKTALIINQVCGSGLRSVALGAQQIQTGDASIIVAGGQESMTLAPHAQYLRAGIKMGDTSFVDTMIKDGLWDAFHGYHMGLTAENVAEKWQVTREQQDEFAAASQQKAEAAIKGGHFQKEIVPITIASKKGDIVVSQDEFPRFGTSVETLAKLKPAFKKDGTVTAGNASGINDGAAAVVLMSAETAAKRGLTPLARIAAWATTGVDPAIMGIGPVSATRKALAKAGWTIDSVDLFEANEAFAAQSVAVGRELGIDPAKLNVNGGAIALGHPIGASGTRVLVTLLHELDRRGLKRGVATLCIGGGMGVAMCVERT